MSFFLQNTLIVKLFRIIFWLSTIFFTRLILKLHKRHPCKGCDYLHSCQKLFTLPHCTDMKISFRRINRTNKYLRLGALFSCASNSTNTAVCLCVCGSGCPKSVNKTSSEAMLGPDSCTAECKQLYMSTLSEVVQLGPNPFG